MHFCGVVFAETKTLKKDEFIDYIQNKLIPVCNEQWGKGGYLIMMCDSPDLVITPLCEDCGLPVPNESYYIAISHDALENNIDLEEVILIDSYDDNGYGLKLARKIEDCDCKDYDDEDDEDEDDEDDDE